MRIYEELFVVDPKATDEQVDAVVAQVEDVIKNAGGAIDKIDKWGVRKLAYRIQKKEEGFYVLVQFSAGAEAIREIERRLRVDETVLKYITVRIDEKMKWLEKRKKIRDKRAAKRPQAGPPAHRAPAEAPAARPGAPAPAAPAAPSAPEAPKAPAATEAPKAPAATEAPKAPAATEAPKAPAATEAPKTPAAAGAPAEGGNE